VNFPGFIDKARCEVIIQVSDHLARIPLFIDVLEPFHFGRSCSGFPFEIKGDGNEQFQC